VPRPRLEHVALGAVALLALAVRVAYDLSMDGYPVIGDAATFHLVAQGLADGHGFTAALPPFGPTAEHPPLFELFLAALDKLGASGFRAQRLAIAGVGMVNVVLVALLARRLLGRAAGLVAGAIAAVYPLLFTADGALMSEPLYGTFLLGALLCASFAPSRGRAASLGALIGLAALTRGEGLALLVLLALPLLWRRPRLIGVAVLAAAVTIAPWTIRNALVFHRAVPISTNSSGLFVGANCHDTYYGVLLGSWRFQCYTPRRPGEDEAAYFARERGIGLRYARRHAGRLPVVLAARLGRELDVFRYGQSLFLNAAEGRRADWVGRGILVYWGVGLLALLGAALLARRRARQALLVLAAPIALCLLVALATYGGTRFRYAAEPSLVILAAGALVELGRAAARRGRRRPA
jgi:4-amino-4-deoxy-L-arabinose transferase-like glycosyltransferase